MSEKESVGEGERDSLCERECVRKVESGECGVERNIFQFSVVRTG